MLDKLLVSAAENVVGSARLLRDLIVAHPEAHELVEQMQRLEHEGDRLTHDLIHRLRSGPPRTAMAISDGHALASALDDVVDHSEEVAGTLSMYAVEAPMAQAEEMVDVLVDAAEQVRIAVGRMTEGIQYDEQLVEIHRLENQGDRLMRDAVRALFDGGIDPMVVIRWKDIFGQLEQAIDACETVAHVLEGIALRSGRPAERLG